ncbi:MAG TPA: Fe-S cluster assembly protein SufD [Candidatus Polarisedimenticolia bacterium]|nr:Fe-S cluster assembly protein SufD [Candidatus Polarisedimenticolia bacterium]
MTDHKNGAGPLLETFARHEKQLTGQGGSWTAALRRRALERFAERGFPTLKDEAWRQTSVAPIAKTPFALKPAYRLDGVTPQVLERMTFEPWTCTHIVFVDGHHVPELSRLRPLPAGVKLGNLKAAVRADRARVEPHLAHYAEERDHPFTALNTAFMGDGACIEVPRGVAVDEPIHLLFVSTGDGEGAAPMSHPRNLILAGAGSRLTVVESYVGLGRGVYLTNAVSEIVVSEGAAVDHYKLQRESDEAFHVATLQARLDRDSVFASHSVALGGSLVRNEVNAVLDGPGVDCTLNGLYVASGGQHVDNHTSIDHARPHGTSRELYKGVLGDRARGVFEGTIIVRQDAQKTDARQTNKNLLISDEALVDTKPQLQILADDVKCTHGATIGQIDEDAMFYLRTRAVGEEMARNILIHAFVNDLLDRIKVDAIRAGLECLLATQLPRHTTREAL